MRTQQRLTLLVGPVLLVRQAHAEGGLPGSPQGIGATPTPAQAPMADEPAARADAGHAIMSPFVQSAAAGAPLQQGVARDGSASTSEGTWLALCLVGAAAIGWLVRRALA